MRLSIRVRNLLCIDWDERSLRVVDASFSRGDVRIRNAVHVPLAPGTDVRDPASLGDFLRRTLGEHRIRTRRAVVDIPRQDAVLNLLSLPNASTDELAAMVDIQMAKELPFSKDQAVIDFALAREQGANTCDVWVAAVRNNVLDHYRQVAAAAGLRLERIGLRPHANVVAVTHSGITEGRTLVVDVGPSMTEINVIRDGRLVYSRAASVSVPAEGLFTPARPAPPASAEPGPEAIIPLADDSVPRPGPMEALLIEVSRTIEAYRATDPGASIDRIVLAGTAGMDRRLAGAFEARFRAPTVVYTVPEWLRGPAARELPPAPFSAAIGLALSYVAEGVLHFDLLHPKEAEAGRRERARRIPVAAATAALFVVAAAVFAYHPIRQKNASIASYKKQIEQLNVDKEDRDEFMQQWRDVKAWTGMSTVWVDQLKRLAEVFPANKEAYIDKLEFNSTTAGSKITIELAAVDKTVATKLVTDIEAIRQEIEDGPGRKRQVQVFEAKPGNSETNHRDPKYPVSDEVFVTLKSSTPEATSKSNKQ